MVEMPIFKYKYKSKTCENGSITSITWKSPQTQNMIPISEFVSVSHFSKIRVDSIYNTQPRGRDY